MRAPSETCANVAILGFHKIGEPPPGTWATWNYVPVETFQRYLEELITAGFHVVDLGTFLDGLADPKAFDRPTAVLTFDDGYESFLHVTEPLLRRHGLPSVLFVPTAFVGGTNAFDAGQEPEERMCDWDQLRELQDRGVAVQPHGVSHRAFSDLDLREQGDEVRHSKQVLEQRLGAPMRVFAFPYGDNGTAPEATDDLLRSAGYEAACLYRGGVLAPGCAQPFRLPRLPIGPDSNLRRALEKVP